MFPDIGLSELLVILVVALVVMKPEDVPVVMRQLGVWTAHIQRYMAGIWSGWQEKMH